MFQAPQERSEPSFTPCGSGELKARKPVCSDNDEEILFGAKFKLSPRSCRGCISKGKKTKAFAIDGPLGTLDLHGGDVSNEPDMFYSIDEMMSEKFDRVFPSGRFRPCREIISIATSIFLFTMPHSDDDSSPRPVCISSYKRSISVREPRSAVPFLVIFCV